jgi:hypothetical protein
MRLERLLIVEIWHARLKSLDQLLHKGEPGNISERGRDIRNLELQTDSGFDEGRRG